MGVEVVVKVSVGHVVASATDRVDFVEHRVVKDAAIGKTNQDDFGALGKTRV